MGRRRGMARGRLRSTVRVDLLERRKRRGSLPLTDVQQFFYDFRRLHHAPYLSKQSFHRTVRSVLREEGIQLDDVMLRPAARGSTYFLGEEESVDGELVEELEHDEPLAVLFVEKNGVARRLSYSLRDSGVRVVSTSGVPTKAMRAAEEQYRRRGVPTYLWSDYDAGGWRISQELPEAKRIQLSELEQAMDRRIPGKWVERDAWADGKGYPNLPASERAVLRELANRSGRVRYPARLEIGAVAEKVSYPKAARGLLKVMGGHRKPDYARLLNAVGVVPQEDADLLKRLREAMARFSQKRVGKVAAAELENTPLEEFSLPTARRHVAAKAKGAGWPPEAVKLLQRAAEVLEAASEL